MSEYALTPVAKADIFEIWTYIAEDSEAAADRVEQAIYDACFAAAKTPLVGHLRPELTDRSLRFWTLRKYPNYSIVYRPETVPLEVVAVLHGKRDIPRVLGDRP